MLYPPLQADEKLKEEIVCVGGGITWLLQIYTGQWVFYYALTLVCSIVYLASQTLKEACVAKVQFLSFIST